MANNTQEAVGHGLADATGVVAEKSGGSGMPQLDFSTFPNQIFWLLVAIGAIYYVLSRIALPRIAAVLAERKGTITNDLMAAEDLKAQAEEAEEAYQKALSEARAEAHRIAGEARAEIQAELDIATQKADAEIAARAAESEKAIAEIREGAVASVQEVATQTTADVLGALGHKADAQAVAGAVAARMKG